MSSGQQRKYECFEVADNIPILLLADKQALQSQLKRKTDRSVHSPVCFLLELGLKSQVVRHRQDWYITV